MTHLICFAAPLEVFVLLDRQKIRLLSLLMSTFNFIKLTLIEKTDKVKDAYERMINKRDQEGGRCKSMRSE